MGRGSWSRCRLDRVCRHASLARVRRGSGSHRQCVEFRTCGDSTTAPAKEDRTAASKPRVSLALLFPNARKIAFCNTNHHLSYFAFVVSVEIDVSAEPRERFLGEGDHRLLRT